jgi:predicted AAA+ superfamily ATPase
MAKASRAQRLALVHIQRNVRRERFKEIRELAGSIEDLKVLVPKPGDRLKI